MKKKVKMQYLKSREVNGVIYKSARIYFSKTKLEEMGINESSPYVNIEYDVAAKKIIISPVK